VNRKKGKGRGAIEKLFITEKVDILGVVWCHEYMRFRVHACMRFISA
jgi:hypothetical protein